MSTETKFARWNTPIKNALSTTTSRVGKMGDNSTFTPFTIIGYTLDDINVELNTSLEDIIFPTNFVLHLNTGGSTEIEITTIEEIDTYDPETTGEYQFKANYILPSWIDDVPIEITFNVIVYENYIIATGGTITTSGDFKIHTFLNNGVFNVTQLATTSLKNEIEYLIVAGGGSGARSYSSGSSGSGGGGGGAGGMLEGTYEELTIEEYSVIIGNGGAEATNLNGTGNKGGDSSIFSLVAKGGGAGVRINFGTNAEDGGSGGGGGGNHLDNQHVLGGDGVEGQGHDGGRGNVSDTASARGGGGGGGANSAGSDAINGTTGASGGSGKSNSISGSPVTYAVGGRGSRYSYSATAGTNNRGNGGGGGRQSTSANGAAGGSGIVILKYRYQN